MAQPAVVVVFSSRCGATEKLAHAAAVGTVNARALPRLRRLAHDGDPAPPECADTLRRMKKEYVPPTEADIAGAPALVIVPSAGMTPASDAWRPFLALLEPLVSTGILAGKVAAVIDAGDSQTVASFSAALAARGFALIAGDDRDARAHGRAVGTAIISAASPSAH
jgi:flavodoxin